MPVDRYLNTGSNYVHPNESNLLNIHKALEYDGLGRPSLRTIINTSTVQITGPVNILSTVTVASTPENPIHNHIVEVGTSGLLNVPYLPIGGTVTATQGTTPWVITGTVAVSNFTSTVFVSNTVTISNTSFAVTNFPTTSTVYQGTNPWVVTGTVATTIADVITVIVDEDAGANYSFNNHATNANRGWTMDNTMRPVISIRVTDTGTTVADLVKITEYEIGNNNANQSTIIYEWYEGPLTISGAAIPAWTNAGTKTQYRVYQDQYSSNQGNTFTVPAGTHMRHSGIIIGKNAADDEGPATLKGGATPNMLTLCMKRVDNATKLDVWFAFTIKELA